VKSSDGVLDRNWGECSRCERVGEGIGGLRGDGCGAGGVCACILDQFEAHCVVVLEGEDSRAEASGDGADDDADLAREGREPVAPEFEAVLSDRESGCVEEAGSMVSSLDVRPREEGHDGAGASRIVAVVEVVGSGVVEVDGLLDEAEAEDSGVELDVACGVAGDGGDVVDAACGVAGGFGRVHDGSPSGRGRLFLYGQSLFEQYM